MYFLLFLLVIWCSWSSDADTSTKIHYLPNGQVGGYELIINNTVRPAIDNLLPHDHVSKIVTQTSNVGSAFTGVDERVIGENSYLKVHRILQQQKQQNRLQPQRQVEVKYPVKTVLVVPSVRYANGLSEYVKLRFAQIGPYAALLVPLNRTESSGSYDIPVSPEIRDSIRAYVEVREAPQVWSTQVKRTGYAYPPATYEIQTDEHAGTSLTENVQQSGASAHYIYPPEATSISEPSPKSSEIKNNAKSSGFVIQLAKSAKGEPNVKGSENTYQEFFVPARVDQLDPEKSDKVIANPFRYSSPTAGSTSQFAEVYSKDEPSISSLTASHLSIDYRDKTSAGSPTNQLPESDANLNGQPTATAANEPSGLGPTQYGLGLDAAPLGSGEQIDGEEHADRGNFQIGWPFMEAEDPEPVYDPLFTGPPPGQPEFSDVSPGSFVKNSQSLKSALGYEGLSKLEGNFNSGFQDGMKSHQESNNPTYAAPEEGQTSDATASVFVDSNQENVDWPILQHGKQSPIPGKSSSTQHSLDRVQEVSSSSSGQIFSDSSAAAAKISTAPFTHFQNAARQNLAHASHDNYASITEGSVYGLKQFQNHRNQILNSARQGNIALSTAEPSRKHPLFDADRFKAFIQNPSLTSRLNLVTPKGQTAAVLTLAGNQAKVELPLNASEGSSSNGDIVIPEIGIPFSRGGDTAVEHKGSGTFPNSKYDGRGTSIPLVKSQYNSFNGLQNVQKGLLGSSLGPINLQRNILDSVAGGLRPFPYFDSASAAAAAAAAVTADKNHFNQFSSDKKIDTTAISTSHQQADLSDGTIGIQRPLFLQSGDLNVGTGTSETYDAAYQNLLPLTTSDTSSFDQKELKEYESVTNEFGEQAFNGPDADTGSQSISSQFEQNEKGGTIKREYLSYQVIEGAGSSANGAKELFGNSQVDFVPVPGFGKHESLLVTPKDHLNVKIPKYLLPVPIKQRIPLKLLAGVVANQEQRNQFLDISRPEFSSVPLGRNDKEQRLIPHQYTSPTVEAHEDADAFAKTQAEAAAGSSSSSSSFENVSATKSHQPLADSIVGRTSFDHAEKNSFLTQHNEGSTAQLMTDLPTSAGLQLTDYEQKADEGHLSAQFQKGASSAGNSNFRAQEIGNSPSTLVTARGIGPNTAFLSPVNRHAVTLHLPGATGKSQQLGEITLPKYAIPAPNEGIPINLQTGGSVILHDGYAPAYQRYITPTIRQYNQLTGVRLVTTHPVPFAGTFGNPQGLAAVPRRLKK